MFRTTKNVGFLLGGLGVIEDFWTGAVYLFTFSLLIAGNIYHFNRTKEALLGTK
jgi:hypothetical protein